MVTNGAALRKLLVEIVDRETRGLDRVALLLSGGVDSLSLGFVASEDLGLDVHAYTFRVSGRPNVDSEAAAIAAKKFGWAFSLVETPTTASRKEFEELRDRWRCRKKTQFECTWPFLFVAPVIREEAVLSGIAADGHYGVSRKAMAKLRVMDSKAVFDEFRRDYFEAENPAGQVQQKALLEANGVRQIAPYLDREVAEFFLAFDWKTLNRPKQKQIARDAFAPEFRRVRARDHANLQLVAEIETCFAPLLDSDLNPRKRRRLLDLYRDHAKA